MTTQGPHDRLSHDLQRLLEPDPGVLALTLFGSATRPDRDAWSDLDALIVLTDDALARYHPSLAWLAPLGAVFAHDHSTGVYSATTRVCFDDFRRLDVVFTPETSLARLDAWPSIPFWAGCTVLFSRLPQITEMLTRRFAPPEVRPLSAEQMDAMVEQFWFKSALTVVKVVRGDLLIALHLALDLVRDCCVLKMLLRDRAEGTNHHRHGGIGNPFVLALDTMRTPYTAHGILDGVAHSAFLFDTLAAEFMAGYVPRRGPLLAALTSARRSLTDTPSA